MKANSFFTIQHCITLRFLLTLFTLHFSLFISLAQSVQEQQARQRAAEFFHSRYEVRDTRYENTSKLELAYTAAEQKLYVYNHVENGGFVIVAGDERAENSILGWSDNGPFDYEKAPCGLKALLEQYAEGISHILSRNSKLEHPKSTLAPSKTVGPLLTTQWSQWEPYNGQCPAMNEGYMPPTGCVATAMAQIMNYWQWPKQGYGAHQNSCDTKEYRDFTKSHYDWNNMLNTYSEGS